MSDQYEQYIEDMSTGENLFETMTPEQEKAFVGELDSTKYEEMIATLRARITALEAAGDALTHPKHAYRYYCMWCGNLIVNIDHSPDCPVEKWKAIR